MNTIIYEVDVKRLLRRLYDMDLRLFKIRWEFLVIFIRVPQM